MYKDFYVGEFWFNDDVENKKIGYLEKVDDKYYLQLQIPFTKKQIEGYEMKTYSHKEIDKIIHGKIINDNIFTGSEYISLLGVSYLDCGMSPKEYHIKYMIFEEIINNNKVLVKNIQFSCNGLFEFFGKGAFNCNQISTDGGNVLISPNKIELEITKDNFREYLGKLSIGEEKYAISLINKGSKRFNQSKHLNYLDNKNYSILESFNISNKIFLNIKIENSISLKDVEKILITFKKLLSLIFLREVKLTDINIDNYKIIFNEGFLYDNNLVKESGEVEILFNYENIGNEFINILNRFFINDKKYRTIYNLYYATLQNRFLHLENQFLNLIQAVEGIYNLSSLYEKNCSEEEIITIKDSINKLKLDKKIRDKIGPIKEKSLERKLKTISEYLGVEFKINNGKDLRSDIEKIRNIFSHGGDRSDLINTNLYNLTLLLQIILELFILKELGLNDNLYNSIKKVKINILKGNIL